MAKLQSIKRENGTFIFSVNIPIDIIRDLGWERGDVLSLVILPIDGVSQVVITREDDGQ